MPRRRNLDLEKLHDSLRINVSALRCYDWTERLQARGWRAPGVSMVRGEVPSDARAKKRGRTEARPMM